jgi:hypothetical protein
MDWGLRLLRNLNVCSDSLLRHTMPCHATPRPRHASPSRASTPQHCETTAGKSSGEPGKINLQGRLNSNMKAVRLTIPTSPLCIRLYPFASLPAPAVDFPSFILCDD